MPRLINSRNNTGLVEALNDVARAGYSSATSSLQQSESDELGASVDQNDCTSSHCCGNADGIIRKSLKGADLLIGGDGIDIFCYDELSDSSARASDRDKIIAFNPGEDRIDLSGLDADTSQPGVQSFVFIGDESLSDPQPGQLRYSNGILSADLDGDSIPDFAIKLAQAPVLTSDNFLF